MDNAQEKILFAIHGPGVDHNFRLDIFAGILESYQHVLDRTYLAAVGKRRMTPTVRESFLVEVTTWKRGSILMDLAVMAVPFAQGYFDYSNAIGKFPSVSELIEASYNFLKARLEAIAKTGRAPTVNIINSPGILFQIGDNGQLNVSQSVIDTATNTEPHYKKLTSYIDDKQVSGISSISQNEQGIRLTSADNALFNPATEIADESEEILAKIYRFDIESRSGKLRIVEAKDLEKGFEFRFEVMGEQPLEPYIDALHSNVKYTKMKVLREIVRHPSGVITVAALHVQKIGG